MLVGGWNVKGYESRCFNTSPLELAQRDLLGTECIQISYISEWASAISERGYMRSISVRLDSSSRPRGPTHAADRGDNAV